MLAIARGLMACPKLLLLDEPSLGLAPLVVRFIFEFIRKLRDEGQTILLVRPKTPGVIPKICSLILSLC